MYDVYSHNLIYMGVCDSCMDGSPTFKKFNSEDELVQEKEKEKNPMASDIEIIDDTLINNPTFITPPPQKIDNLRDLSRATALCTIAKLKEGIIYRTAAPTRATAIDLELIINHLKVVTLIDMRGVEECANDKSAIVIQHYTNPNQNRLKRHHIPLIGSKFKFTVVSKASFYDICDAAVNYVSGDKMSAAKVVSSHMNQIGLLGLYKLFLDQCQAQICEVLTHFLDVRNFPIMYFCNIGKDRTGVISALILAIIEVPNEYIIADYVLTQQIIHYADYQRTMKKVGLKKEFMDAPADVMEATLDYINTKYGGVSEFLTKIGFGIDKQYKLKKLVSENVLDLPCKIDVSY